MADVRGKSTYGSGFMVQGSWFFDEPSDKGDDMVNTNL